MNPLPVIAAVLLALYLLFPRAPRLIPSIHSVLDQAVPPLMAVNTIHAVTSPNSLCSQLSGKRILLVGPETTYHLHSLLLDSCEGHENRSHECVGPEFCTFHHICAPPNPPSDKFTLQNDDRYKKPPSRSELTATKSSMLRYVHSTSLYASSDSKDPMYTLPQIDSDTGVRIKNAYWLTRARQADVIVLNRGPIAAPAWSYNEGGNWTFVDALYRNSSMVYLSDDTFRHSSTRAPNSRRIINAAIHTSLTVFLPAVIGTLRTLSQDQALRHKLILWHGSWFMQPTCNSVKPISSVEDLLESSANPWALYYNSQVYIQNYLLPSILPDYDVRFLGLPSPQITNIQHDSRDCLRPPLGSLPAEELKQAFLGRLVEALEL